MKRINESLKAAINAIWLNRSRAIMTMLGIIIGISSVVAMVSLGNGVQAFILDSFAGLGADQLTITSKTPDSDTRTRIEPITTADLTALENRDIAPSIAMIGAEYSLTATVIAAQKNTSTSIRGVTPNMSQIEDWDVAGGSYITQSHMNNRERVAVLGVDVVEALYGDKNYQPLGEIIKIDGQTFEVVGIMAPRGSGTSNDDDSVMIPLATAQTRLVDARVSDGYEISTLTVNAISQDAISIASDEIEQYFYAAHGIKSEDEEDFSISDQSGILTTVSLITGLLTVFLGVVASISLLVGGIGIMNIMLVSVTERTREIGLRKAVGARPFDILSQFLMESFIISILGGAVGILFAVLITSTVSQLIPQLVLEVDSNSIIIATIVSSLVGIIFGILPANRAAQMNPIDALRFE